MPFVCVQPMLTSWARRSEDLTFDKTDEKDAVLIARLTAQPRCYIPGPIDETWGRLRHLGARRAQLLVESGSQIQQMRALLECVWPAALQTARQPDVRLPPQSSMIMRCPSPASSVAPTRQESLASTRCLMTLSHPTPPSPHGSASWWASLLGPMRHRAR